MPDACWVWRGTTAEMNPRIDPAIISEAREVDPANAAAEYDAQFRDDIAQFVTREVVDQCTPPGRYELPPMASVTYYAFTDPSGGAADSMTLAIAHREGERGILDCVREVKAPFCFSPEAVVKEFAAVLSLYNLTKVVGDRYSGLWCTRALFSARHHLRTERAAKVGHLPGCAAGDETADALSCWTYPVLVRSSVISNAARPAADATASIIRQADMMTCATPQWAHCSAWWDR